MQSAFTEIEQILEGYELKRENTELKERISKLLHVNGGLRGANRKLKDTVKQLRHDN